MALVACTECGNEISTEAKTCSHCGAKNKFRKRSSASSLLVAIAVIGFGYGIYGYFEPELNPNIPACDSAHGRKVIIRSFESSPYALNNNLRVTSVVKQTEVSSDPLSGNRVCEVTFRLNDASTRIHLVSFEKKEQGGYTVHGRPK
jgi:hypothetical protein